MDHLVIQIGNFSSVWLASSGETDSWSDRPNRRVLEVSFRLQINLHSVRLTILNCNAVQTGGCGYRGDDATCTALRDVRSHYFDRRNGQGQVRLVLRSTLPHFFSQLRCQYCREMSTDVYCSDVQNLVHFSYTAKGVQITRTRPERACEIACNWRQIRCMSEQPFLMALKVWSYLTTLC